MCFALSAPSSRTANGAKATPGYELDEDGNRIRDADGKFVFNAVPTTDWGSPETLEYWRQTWAELCNAKFAEKVLMFVSTTEAMSVRAWSFFPPSMRAQPSGQWRRKGIRTEKGEFNRWIKATNAVIRDIKKKIALLFDWIAEAKAELAKPQAPDLVSLLNAYYTQRRAGAYSQKGKVSNLKEMNETFNYLRANGIYSLEDLESRVSEHSAATESLKKTLDEQTARMKAIKQLYDSSAAFQNLKPVYDGLQKIKFEKPRAKYKAEHEAELIQFYAARRKLTGEFPDGKVDMKKLSEEYDELEQAHNTTYGEFKTVRDDLHRLWKVKSCVDTAARFNERTEEQKLQNGAYHPKHDRKRRNCPDELHRQIDLLPELGYLPVIVRLTGRTPSVWKIFFSRTQGETLIKSGREYRWKEHDSLTVRGNKWFRHSQSKGGYPIDFVMEFYGKSFPEAVQLLTGESGEGQTEATTAPPTAFHLPLHNRTADRAIQYLCESRGLNKTLVEAFLLPRGYLRGRKAAQCCVCRQRPKRYTEIRPCARNGRPIQTGYCRV